MSRRLTRRTRLLLVGLLAVAATLAALLVAIPSAYAAASLTFASNFPANTTVGQSGLPASLQITNTSSTPDDASDITVVSIDLVPACGATSYVGNGNCPVPSADPGVFQVSAGTGDSSSACAGLTFTAKVNDTTTGRVVFTPSSSLVLSENATCTIDYTISVLKLPTHPVGTSAPDTADTEQFAYVAGTNGLNHSAATVANSSSLVAKAAPSIVTTASGPITIGGGVTDAARLSNGASPTGTITFDLYAPGDTMCQETPVYTTSDKVSRGNATYYTALAYTATAPGVYNWVASYSGDSGNAAVSEPCGSAGESVTVSQFIPSISTTASSTITIGGMITDSATLTGGGDTPSGTITFNAYGPDDPTCSATSVFTSTVNVSAGNGTYASAAFAPATAGTYNWTASYDGDQDNAAANEQCGGTNESVTVGKASPSIATQASISDPDVILDTATVSGGFNPGGTVTFELFGPNDATCTGASAFSSTVAVASSGESSAPFTPSEPGSYVWIATYNGDANNNATSESCGAADETVSIPMIVTTSTLPDAPIDQAYKQTLTVAGGKKIYHWSVSAGTLPNGLKLSTAGVLAGTPSTAGTSDFTVAVSDSSKPALTTTAVLSLMVTPMSVATSVLPSGTLGVAYTGKLATSGGKSAFHWSVASGSLPAGLKLSIAGALSGTPTSPGTANFVVHVTDSAKPANVASEGLSITIAPMTITTLTVPPGHIGTAYTASLAYKGGIGEHKWSVVAGSLPAGIQLSIAGKLSGKPTTAETSTFTVQVADSAKPTPNSATQVYTITIG